MAKVKGPCMSMDARGQLGKTLVFMGWKGIKDVRSYVVPANPKSDGQVEQRGFLADAVSQWKGLLCNALDKAAFNLVASLEATPMSGFNSFVKKNIACRIAGNTPLAVAQAVVTVNTGGDITVTTYVGGMPTIKGRYGSNPLTMGNVLDGVVAGGTATFAMVGFTEGEAVYFQPYNVGPDGSSMSGIYRIVSAA